MLDKTDFNHHFFKFRIRYYFNETKELLARHKLLMAFIICLFAPGVKNIQAIGIPFYSIIDPEISLNIKLMYMIPLVFFLLALTKAQSSFIKGGAFREYLHTLYIPARVHKKIDLMILLLSLNLIWLAILFGGATIYRQTGSLSLIFSQYALYGAAITILITLLFNALYKKWTNTIFLIFELALVAALSTKGGWFLNTSMSVCIYAISGLILWKVQPFERSNYWFKTVHIGSSNSIKLINPLKGLFLIQLAVYRENRKSFFIRLTLCCGLSILLLNLLASHELNENSGGIVLFFTTIETYILSTLFIFFEQGQRNHSLFHQIFPCYRIAFYVSEVSFVAGLLIVVFFPLVLSRLFTTLSYFSVHIIAISLIILFINRILYKLSLRFCLFTSLISTVGISIIQYIVLGAFFDY